MFSDPIQSQKDYLDHVIVGSYAVIDSMGKLFFRTVTVVIYILGSPFALLGWLMDQE